MPARKIDAMHKAYGRDYGYKCGDCPWLSRKQGYGKAWYKCAAYGDSASESSDWAKRWDACGLRGKDISGLTPMVKRLERNRKADKPCDGQIDMFQGAEDDTY